MVTVSTPSKMNQVTGMLGIAGLPDRARTDITLYIGRWGRMMIPSDAAMVSMSEAAYMNVFRARLRMIALPSESMASTRAASVWFRFLPSLATMSSGVARLGSEPSVGWVTDYSLRSLDWA